MATTQMIRTEPPPAQPRWTSLSGSILEGGYELQDLFEATDIQARFKVRVLGDRELESVAALFLLPEAEIERQVELWRNVKMLRHPHVSAPLGAGRLELDGVPLAYVVLRRADETLSGALRDRPLTAEETGETFTSVARALEALHLNGWAHGCLSPDQVLAVGNYIQWPGACARTFGVPPVAQTAGAKYLAPESAKANLTPEADLWCLGATLFEALTQKAWTEESRKELEALPEPFAAIAFRCLETSPEARCSLAEAVALHRGELKLPPRVRAAVAAPAIVVPEQEIAAAPEPPSEPPPKPVEAKSEQQPKTEQPKTKMFVEGAGEAAAAPPKPSTDPQTATSPVQPSANKTDAHLPQAAAIAALAPEANARAAGTTPGHSVPAANSSAYTQPKPSLVVRTKGEESRRRAAPGETEESKSHWWIWGGSVLCVLALIWFLRPKHQPSVAVSNSSPQAKSSPATGQSGQGSAWQTRTLGPGTAASTGSNPPAGSAAHNRSMTAKPASSASAPAAVRQEAHSRVPAGSAVAGKNVWRVILYTYSRLPDAERKAKDINARHSGLRAEVFSPSGDSGPYLVTTEARPNREEALQEKRKAMGAGMPRDAYIQNYSR